MLHLNTQKKPALTDWHNADIKCALEKKGYSLARLSRLRGYNRNAAAMALFTPWPKMEAIIADALGISPQTIWPTRYGPDGKSNRKRGYNPATHGSTRRSKGVIQDKGAA